MTRWLIVAAFGLLALLVACAVAVILLIGHVDLSSLAARRASAALGRPVSITGLHVTAGRWIMVDLEGVRVGNVAGGSRPTMVELGHLSGQVEALSLLRGPPVIRRLVVDRLSILLEQTRDHRRNWQFGASKPKHPPPPKRTKFPVLLDGRLRDSEVIYRTSGGTELPTILNDVTIQTAGADQPVRLTVAGAYHGAPVSLTGDLQPIAVLRDASTPYRMDLRLRSNDTVFTFKGTMRAPLDVQGAKGAAMLDAPTPKSLLTMTGASGPSDLSLRLAGTLERNGDLWSLTGASGALKNNPVSAASVHFTEGGNGKPDQVAADIAFERLDLNGLLKGGGGGGKSSPDIPLDVVRAPDPVADLHLSARQLTYGSISGTAASLNAAAHPGEIAVTALGLTYLGAQIKAEGRIEAADKGGGRISGNVVALGADVQQLRQLLGFGPVPLSGKLDAQLVVASSGATLNGAARAAEVSAAVSMNGGSIGRRVVEMASTDIRSLFRRSEEMSPVTCLLGVLNMRAGVGTVSPLRIRTADGTVVGNARFDLYRRMIDLTIGSQPASTGIFALDIPVRVSGSFADPTVRPASWSGPGRDMLAKARTASQFPPSLQQVVQRNPCRDPAQPAKRR